MHRDGRLLWLHLVYGDGWSAQWWADTPTNGEVTLTGTFNAMLTDFGVDTPPRVHGRVRSMHLVDEQVRSIENGWTTIDGTDRLTEIDAIPVAHDWWPSKDTEDGDFVSSGVLIDIDLDDNPSSLGPFAAGAVTIRGNSIWVMHSSDPVLVQVDTAGAVPVRGSGSVAGGGAAPGRGLDGCSGWASCASTTRNAAVIRTVRSVASSASLTSGCVRRNRLR